MSDHTDLELLQIHFADKMCELKSWMREERMFFVTGAAFFPPYTDTYLETSAGSHRGAICHWPEAHTLRLAEDIALVLPGESNIGKLMSQYEKVGRFWLTRHSAARWVYGPPAFRHFSFEWKGVS